VHNVGDVKHSAIHTAKPLVPGPSHLEVEIAIEKLKDYKSPDRDKIPADLIRAGSETLLSVILKLINLFRTGT
jgi:hypothetical protein